MIQYVNYDTLVYADNSTTSHCFDNTFRFKMRTAGRPMPLLYSRFPPTALMRLHPTSSPSDRLPRAVLFSQQSAAADTRW